MFVVAWLSFAMKITAQVPLREFKIRFDQESAVLDTSIGNNAEELEAMKAYLHKLEANGYGNVLRIIFSGAASPTGSKEFNDELTVERRETLKEYIAQHCTIPEAMTAELDYNIDWYGLRDLVEQSDMEYKDEIISIIDKGSIIIPYYDDRTIDQRAIKLRKLGGGSVWAYIADKYFPYLRYAKLVITLRHADDEEGIVATVEAEPAPEENKAEVVEDALEPAADNAIDEEYDDNCREQRMALKTNLIYDAILMPSLRIDYRINDRWSVNLQGDVAWWKNDPKHKYYQIATITPEVRYHFNPSTPWKGHYVGLFAGFSWYDLENGARGYKGEAGLVGLSYYYAWPISKYFSLEAGLGVGYLYARNREYLPIDGHYVYQQTTRLNYLGPLRAEFAVVWRFWNQKCKGGKR